MNFLLNVFFISLLFLFQTTILHSFTMFGVRPDMVLILTFLIAVSLGGDKGATAGFALGLIQDCLSSSIFGINAFSKGVVGFIFGNLREKIFFDNFFSRLIFVVLAALIDAAIILPVSLLTITNKAEASTILSKLLFSSVYTALAGPLFIQIFIFFSSKTSALLKKRHEGSGIREQLTIRPRYY